MILFLLFRASFFSFKSSSFLSSVILLFLPSFLLSILFLSFILFLGLLSSSSCFTNSFPIFMNNSSIPIPFCAEIALNNNPLSLAYSSTSFSENFGSSSKSLLFPTIAITIIIKNIKIKKRLIFRFNFFYFFIPIFFNFLKRFIIRNIIYNNCSFCISKKHIYH